MLPRWTGASTVHALGGGDGVRGHAESVTLITALSRTLKRSTLYPQQQAR